jgi:protein-histidine N-methyltransferase
MQCFQSSLDQQGYHPDGSGLSIRGKRVLEAGCGTAVPTLYLLETLFRQLLAEEASGTSSDTKGKTVVHLQDYNAEGKRARMCFLPLKNML